MVTTMARANKFTGAANANSVSGASPLAVLTVDEVAARLQISKASVYELTRFREAADTPRLPARKIGRSLRFVAADIDAWVLALPKHANLQKRRYLKKDPA
jgi:excisionase family DNA binding protein